MFALLRDGFAGDLIILLLVSILLGSLGASGIAAAVDNYFGDTVNELIGDYGEFDVIIHVREEVQDAAAQELERIVAEKLPQASYKKGLTVAGQANFFLSLPPELRNRGILEGLGGIIGDLPGYSGLTYIIEPAITVNNVHPGVRSELWEKMEQIPGVDFIFRQGNNLLVLLDSVDYAAQVSDALEKLLARYQVLEVRLPIGYAAQDVEALSEKVREDIARALNPRVLQDVTFARQGEDTQSFLKALAEMRRFLLSYAAKVDIHLEGDAPVWVGDSVILPGVDDPLVVEVTEINGSLARGVITKGDLEGVPQLVQTGYRLLASGEMGPEVGRVEIRNERLQLVQTIDESLTLVGELDALAQEAKGAVDNAEKTLNTFHQALYKLEELQLQLQTLTQNLQPALEGQGTSSQIFLSLLINSLFKDMLGDGGSQVGVIGDLDVALMRDNLDNIAARLEAVRQVDLDAVIHQMQQVREALPQLREEDMGRSVRLINSYIAGQVIPGEKIDLLVDDAVSPREVERAVQEGLDNEYISVLSTPAGVVRPNTRAELFRVLREVRGIIAGLAAIVFTVLTLILDHATILSAGRRLLAGRKGLLRFLNPVFIFGALTGAALLVPTYILSRANIPFMGLAQTVICGLLLGMLTAVLAERLSPVDDSEMLAGEALGLTYAQIMREIVVPAARPGLLQLLSRCRRKFS
jgi:hypothetical protein